MKVFLLLLVLVLAGAGFYKFYLKDHPPAWLRASEESSSSKADTSSAPVGKKDFKEVSILLQGDMDHIPVNLRDARQMPSHAFDIKSRVAPYIQMHEEYKTLTFVCDTIIGADQNFGERQGKCGLGQAGPGASAHDRAQAAAGMNTAVYQQQEPLWEARRRQADSDVRSKLATLENHRL